MPVIPCWMVLKNVPRLHGDVSITDQILIKSAFDGFVQVGWHKTSQSCQKIRDEIKSQSPARLQLIYRFLGQSFFLSWNKKAFYKLVVQAMSIVFGLLYVRKIHTLHHEKKLKHLKVSSYRGFAKRSPWQWSALTASTTNYYQLWWVSLHCSEWARFELLRHSHQTMTCDLYVLLGCRNF